MNNGYWKQLEALFFDVLERDTGQRDAFLGEACAHDPGLRDELEAMLAAHARSRRLLLENRLLGGDAPAAPPPDALLGTHVGPYRLVERIGQGGMGTVYRAERDDGQYRQQVALKLIRPGLHTAEALARFRVERQILARLAHPRIARLLDGGMTDPGSGPGQAGQPYFVMEYVEGVPIDQYADAHRLTIDARLRLFEDVCEALHYAHQNLVVHRDLKPSNILVAEAEGQPQVKLLDFGIAKLLNTDDEHIGAAGALTQTGLRVMTPEYASPEQVKGEAVTTATDVYALGIVLYELLTGQRPYPLAGRSLSEIERAVCEEEPPRPSMQVTRTRTEGPAGRATPEQVAAARSTDPKRLQRRLAGDLDAILHMALEKEPARRYRSAEGLLADLGRHLAGAPVEARAPTMAYRARKFVRRHRTAVAAAALVLLSLVGGLAMALWQAEQALRERGRAEQALVQAEQALRQTEEVSDFLMGLFEATDPIQALGDTITAQELLARGEERAAELAGQPAVQARMLDVMGQVYRRLGQYDKARALLEQAVARRRLLHDPAELARSLDHLGLLLLDEQRFAEAEALIGEAYTLRRALYPAAHPDRAESLHNLGGLAFEQGRFAAADSLYRAALALRRALLGEDHPQTLRTMRVLAGSLDKLGKYEEAEPVLREVLQQQRRRLGEMHPDVASTLNDLALLLKKKGDLDAARASYRASLTIRRALYGDVHPRVGVALVNYAKLLMEQQAYDEAAPLLSEALSIFRTVHGPDHADVAWALENLARTYAGSGAYERAIPMYREALACQRRTLGPEHPRLATTMTALANALLDLKRYQEAQELYHKSLSLYGAALGERHPNLATVHRHLGRLYHAQGRFVDAERHFRTAVAIYREALPPGHPRTASALISYGELLLDRGAPRQAEPLLREGLAGRQDALPEDSRLVVEAKRALGTCLTRMGRHDEAGPLLQAAIEHLMNFDDQVR